MSEYDMYKKQTEEIKQKQKDRAKKEMFEFVKFAFDNYETYKDGYVHNGRLILRSIPQAHEIFTLDDILLAYKKSKGYVSEK